MFQNQNQGLGQTLVALRKAAEA